MSAPGKRPESAGGALGAAGGLDAKAMPSPSDASSRRAMISDRERVADIESLEELFYNTRREHMQMELAYQQLHADVSQLEHLLFRCTKNPHMVLNFIHNYHAATHYTTNEI